MIEPDSSKRDYQFSSDWFSPQIPNWTEWLRHLKDKPAKALEIGSWEGRSAVWLLDNILIHEDATLTCVDLFPVPETERCFDRNIAASGKQNCVTKLKGESWSHLRKLPPGSFDFIYIDGSHHGRDVLEDAVLAYRLTAQNGIMVFDDYLWRDNPDHSVYPKDAIDAFVSLYREYIRVVYKQWQVCIRKVK